MLRKTALLPATATKRQRREALLYAAQLAQDAFWEALRELEEEIGVDVDSTNDLAGLTIADLKKIAR
jgi:hypothetical protein